MSLKSIGFAVIAVLALTLSARAQKVSNTNSVAKSSPEPIQQKPANAPGNASAWSRGIQDPRAAGLARPTAVQYAWQEQELAMFLQLDPATIQGGE
jgi:hypothetical protein